MRLGCLMLDRCPKRDSSTLFDLKINAASSLRSHRRYCSGKNWHWNAKLPSRMPASRGLGEIDALRSTVLHVRVDQVVHNGSGGGYAESFPRAISHVGR